MPDLDVDLDLSALIEIDDHIIKSFPCLMRFSAAGSTISAQ
ncbi:hypothetical protein [Paracoccus sediminicola]|nr:hypothetical protein [Paracoccus sediminicola]WBU55942.1 hypothetical protein PAF18_10565 [Paracoccus sediminicola]